MPPAQWFSRSTRPFVMQPRIERRHVEPVHGAREERVERADQLDLLAGGRAAPRTSPAAYASAVAVQHDDAVADRRVAPEQHSQRVDDVLLSGRRAARRRAGSWWRSRSSSGRAPVATTTPSGASSDDELRGRLGREPDLDADLRQQPLEVAAGPAELLAPGRPGDEVHLPAQLAFPLDERDLVPAARERVRGAHPRRAAADHEPAAGEDRPAGACRRRSGPRGPPPGSRCS